MNEGEQFQLLDRDGRLIGIVTLSSQENDFYSGKIRLTRENGMLNALFEEFEYAAQNQTLSLLDDLESEIEAWGLSIQGTPVFDVQIMNGDDIAFKIAS